MMITLLKSKLHRVRVTHVELDYEGSCAIDANLLRAAGIREFERIEIYDVTNGERFATYAIRAEAGSGIISVNGAAAHKAGVDDLVIICTYGQLSEAEALNFRPKLVYVDRDNLITRTADEIPEQAA
ncbi:MAG: aspartate 1-decarboxylase [Thiotrichales bacterium]